MFDQDFDNAIVDPLTYANPQDQHALFTQLRLQAPVRWTQPEGYRPFWTIAKHADIMEVERQQEVFITAPRNKLWPISFEEKMRSLSGGRVQVGRGINQMDNPDHRLYRQIAQDWFNPRSLKSLEPRITELARQSMAELERIAPSCDFYRDISQHYPLRVIMLILGLPAADEDRLLAITQRFFAGGDPELAGGRDYIESAMEYFEYFAPIAQQRRANPTDDVASLIANATIDGKLIDGEVAKSYFAALTSAGHDTTSSTASGGVLAMIENPAQWDLLKSRPELVPSAVEEMVRWVSPVKHFMRTATRDYVLRGQTIRAGDAVMLSYPSANRDEDVFEDPWAFRIDRTPNKHVGFGFGPHVCLGMFLARMELQIFFRELLPRVERFRLAGEPHWVQTSFVGGLKALPVQVDLVRQAVAA